jgi:zinc transport system permease protein
VQKSIYELLADLNKYLTILMISHDLGAVSTYVKTVGCLNHRLFYHNDKLITPQMIEQTYQCPIDLIAHGVPTASFPNTPFKTATMVETILQALQFDFMRNALMAGVLVSIACGIIGSLVVVNRIVFISGGIAHAAYGGIGLGYFWGFDPVLGAIAFALVSALGMGWVARKTRQRADTIIGVMWAIGMAIGIIAIDLTQGYKADLMSYLFGSILTVPRQELIIMLVLDLIIGAMVVLFYKELLAISFDPVFATTRNVPVDGLYLMLVGAIALTVVMVMQVVGLIWLLPC